MFSRLFLLSVFLCFTHAVAGRGGEETTVDSLNGAAVGAYDTSYPDALVLLRNGLGRAEKAGYARGVLEATCLQSVIWSNSNRCHDAFSALRSLSPREIDVNPLRYYSAWGACWFNHGNYDSARRYHERALDGPVPDEEAPEYYYERIQLARTYVKSGLQEQALEHYDKAARYFSSSGDSAGIALCEDVAGEIFYTQRLYEKAGIHLLHSCSVFHRLRNYRGEAAALLHLGNNYYMRVMDDSARECYRAALSCCTHLGDSAGMAICYSNLSRIYLEAHDTKAAVAYALKALSTIRPGNYIALEAGTYQQLGDIYGELRQFDAAISYVERALGAARAGDNKVIVRDCYKSLSELYTNRNEPGRALPYLLAAYRLKDSIEPVLFSRRLAEMDARYKAEKREAEIKSLKQQGLISSLKVQQQRSRLQLQWYLLLLLAVVVAGAGSVIYYRNSRRKLLEQLEREKMIKDTEERERVRIARDIHDELGSGLSKIRFLSDHVQARPGGEVPSSLAMISETSRGLIDNMRDLVWAMNPENTTLDSLVARIREYAGEYLEQFPIVVDIDIPRDIPATPISKEVTRNIFMIVREALQNIVKHAGASRVWVRVRVDHAFYLEIGDNGRGYDMEAHRAGNGLGNLAARSRAIGAVLDIGAVPGGGTTLRLTLSLQ